MLPMMNEQSRTSDAILRLERPQGGQPRARKVVSRSRSRGTGKYPSWKMNRMMQWESPHELNAMRLLDADPTVSAFMEQPLIVHYVLAGVEHKHFPDLEVHRRGFRELWEIKTDEDAASLDVEARTLLMTRGLPAFGYSYRVALSSELERQPRLGTALKILRDGRASITPIEREVVRCAFVRGELRHWGDLRDCSLGFYRARAAVTRLVLEGMVRISTDSPLCDRTEMWHTESDSR